MVVVDDMTANKWLNTNPFAKLRGPRGWRGTNARIRKKSCKQWLKLQNKAITRGFYRGPGPLMKWLKWKMANRPQHVIDATREKGRQIVIPL